MDLRLSGSAGPEDETCYFQLPPNVTHETVPPSSSVGNDLPENLGVEAPELPEQTRVEINNYLSSMNPLVIAEDQDNGRERTIHGFIYAKPEERRDSRVENTIRVRPKERDPTLGHGVISVKCTPSSAEIVGTPSEVALRLNREIERYLPSKRTILREEVAAEVSEAEKKLQGKKKEDRKDVEEEEFCPASFDLRRQNEMQAGPKCSGVVDLLTRKITPCNQVRTLREIALGRKMLRPMGTHRREPCPPDCYDDDDDDDDDLVEERNESQMERRQTPGPNRCCTRRTIIKRN